MNKVNTRERNDTLPYLITGYKFSRHNGKGDSIFTFFHLNTILFTLGMQCY